MFYLKFFLQSIRELGHRWRIGNYIKNGQRPWSNGYEAFKWRLIRQSINDNSLILKFRNKSTLPSRYGKFVDERVVEYPWLLSRLSSTPSKLLDAGSILNYQTLIEHPILQDKKIYILTLGPEKNCFWQKNISYIFADMRDLPFKDGYFDEVVSISTLEHVGMDNSMLYVTESEFAEKSINDFVKAVHEINRVLKPGGKCYITVPFGKYQYDVFQQQFNMEMVELLKNAFSSSHTTETYYKYNDDGWNISSLEECYECEYFNVHKTKYFDKSSSLDYDKDLAAAARAVVAIEMTKK